MELCKQVVWIEVKDERLESFSEIILFTSEKGSGKNNSISIYKYYRFLDFWKQLHEDHKDEDFDNLFCFIKVIFKDNTKPYKRYVRWSKRSRIETNRSTKTKYPKKIEVMD